MPIWASVTLVWSMRRYGEVSCLGYPGSLYSSSLLVLDSGWGNNDRGCFNWSKLPQSDKFLHRHGMVWYDDDQPQWLWDRLPVFKIDVICSTVNDVVCAMINHEESKRVIGFRKALPLDTELRACAILDATPRQQSFSVSRVDRVFAVLDKRDNGVSSKAEEAFPTR